MWETKLLISPVKKKIFLPQNDQIWPKIGILGHYGPCFAGSFSALLVGWLVVVARGLYLARELFTLSNTCARTLAERRRRRWSILTLIHKDPLSPELCNFSIFVPNSDFYSASVKKMLYISLQNSFLLSFTLDLKKLETVQEVTVLCDH